jgi:hypothetical protein
VDGSASGDDRCDPHHISLVRTLATTRRLRATRSADTVNAVQALRPDGLTEPLPERLAPGHRCYAEITERHRQAMQAGLPVYTDPVSGLSVFTAEFLADRGYCCESGCRHCPYALGA